MMVNHQFYFSSVKYSDKVKIVQNQAKCESSYISMKTIGIVAEFNPFHKGHLHLINKCMESLNADRCVVIMSGDFVQRGAPAIMDKFSRTKMALSCGVDLVLELPIYYSLGSAEYFAEGAVSILDSLGCIDYLCFGSECGDITLLTQIAELLSEESPEFKAELNNGLKNGLSFPVARTKALISVLSRNEGTTADTLKELLTNPNNILAIEYLKALLRRNSKITPFTVKRIGEGYSSSEISEYSSATAIRELIFSTLDATSQPDNTGLYNALPAQCADIITSYKGKFACSNDFSMLLSYKLALEKEDGFEKYLDITPDLSNKIVASIGEHESIDDLCLRLKSKEIAYSRISRSLMHILLNITGDSMSAFKEDNYTGYARILGAKKSSSDLIKCIRNASSIPVIGNLKEANDGLSPLQKELFDATITSSAIYSQLFWGKAINEYKQKLLLM